jgi:choline kinase
MANAEKWKAIDFPKKVKLQKKYLVSNTGKLASYADSPKNAQKLKAKRIEDYHCISIRMQGVKKSLFVHRLVAEAFLKQPTAKHKFVIHLDHNKSNNHSSNLKWTTLEQQVEHRKSSPAVKRAIKERLLQNADYSKVLTEGKVRKMKTEIFDPKRKRTLKQIANAYGVSEMNVYRIKSGEFWYKVRVKHEPENKKYNDYVKAKKNAGK